MSYTLGPFLIPTLYGFWVYWGFCYIGDNMDNWLSMNWIIKGLYMWAIDFALNLNNVLDYLFFFIFFEDVVLPYSMHVSLLSTKINSSKLLD